MIKGILKRIMIYSLAIVLMSASVSIYSYAGESDDSTQTEILTEDLNGRLVTANEESDANSWRYKDGELIESGGQNSSGLSISLFSSSFSGTASASDSKAFGIDVSKYQGSITWSKTATEIDFAIIRCGYGSNLTSQDDAYFDANASACEEYGIPYGVYLYSYATNTTKAQSEAEHVLRMIEGYNPSLPIYYDLEDDSIFSACTNDEVLAIAKAFCDTIAAAGYQVGIYADLNHWNNYLTSSTYDSWERWVAQWGSSCTYSGSYGLWQYTSSGTVSGISGSVDCDYALVDLDELAGSISSVYVNGKLYSGYYLAENGRMYQLSGGKGSLKDGSVSEGAKYYDAASGETKTLSKQTVYVKGKAYTGYYTCSAGVMYKVTNGTRVKKSGTIASGTAYYSYNDGKYLTLSSDTVYVNGNIYTGYYTCSENVMYTVTKGIRAKKTGTVSAGTKYYSYNSGKTVTLSQDKVYVNGKLYTGYYTCSADVMYKVTNGTRSKKTGSIASGTSYYSYNSGKTVKLSDITVYVSGKKYTGYYTCSAGKMYKVSSGTRTLFTGTLSKGTKYYSYNDAKTITLTASITYSKGVRTSGGLSAVSLKSVTSPSSKAIKVTWTATSGVTGYQIQYSTSSSFSSTVGTKTVTGASTASTTITSLRNSAYYVRIRSYYKSGSSTKYSSWSSAKYITVTK